MDSRKDQQPLSPAAAQMESALRGFAPRGPDLNRDELMFRAGQASLQTEPVVSIAKSGWFWPATTLAASGVAAVLAIMLGIQRFEQPAERIVYVERPIRADHATTDALPEQQLSQETKSSPPTSESFPVATWWPALPDNSVLQMRNVALRWGVEALPSSIAVNSDVDGFPATSGGLWRELQKSTNDESEPSL